jgi:hypothetical protein
VIAAPAYNWSLGSATKTVEADLSITTSVRRSECPCARSTAIRKNPRFGDHGVDALSRPLSEARVLSRAPIRSS